jgi:hypothetical protein
MSDVDLSTIQDFEIEDFIAKVPGKVIAFLDTCFSGGLHPKGPSQPDVDKLANELASAEKGVVVLPRPPAGSSIAGLELYLAHRVKELAELSSGEARRKEIMQELESLRWPQFTVPSGK